MMKSEIEHILENSPIRPFWGRGGIVLTAAAAAVLAGLAAPLGGLAIDILWVCVVSVTIAGAVIFPAAASTADLKGFAALLTLPSLFRIALVAVVCGRLLQGQPFGMLIGAIGNAADWLGPLAAALTALVAAAVLVVALFAACQKIAAASGRYLNQIRPLKCVGIQSDVKAGVITNSQGRTLARKVAVESRLFAHLSGTSLLMRLEGVIEFAALLICLVWPFFSPQAIADSGSERLALASSAALGLGAISLVPAVLSAAAGAYLTGKDSLTLRTAEPADQPAGRTFTLLDKNSGRSEQVELLNPDFADRSDSPADNGAYEQLAEFEPDQQALIETLSFSAETVEAYYRQLAAQVAKAAQDGRIVIFTAEDVRHLPVTVLVNTAILLARLGDKLLLADADRQRQALGHVFDIPIEQSDGAVQSTGLEGMDLIGLYGSPGDMETSPANAARGYDSVLIYAPRLAVWNALADAFAPLTSTAFVFGIDDIEASGAYLTQSLAGCERIVSVPSLPMQHRTAR